MTPTHQHQRACAPAAVAGAVAAPAMDPPAPPTMIGAHGGRDGVGRLVRVHRSLLPWIDVIGLMAAAVAWQNFIAWLSWVWLLPGAAAAICLAVGFVAATAWALTGLPGGERDQGSRGLRQAQLSLPNSLLLGIGALACLVGLGWHALWVMPGDMLGLGLMIGLLAMIFVSKQVPDRWWMLRLIFTGSIIVALLWVTSLQRLSPVFQGIYIAALIAVLIFSARSRAREHTGLPREIFGAVVFALGVGIAPHFMANQGPESWLGREFLACLIVMLLARLCISWVRTSAPCPLGETIDPAAWIQRRGVLRDLLPVALGVILLIGGLLLASPSGRLRWLGAAVMICALWQAPVIWWLRRAKGRGRLIVLLWSAFGPASGPAILWWCRSLLV